MISPSRHFLDDVQRNIGIVHNVCRIYFGADSLEKEDVFQEIMYQLWKSYPSFAGGSKFSTWMYRVSLNTAITYARKSKRQPLKETLSGLHDGLTGDRESGESEDRTRRLYLAIQTLGDIDKAIIILHLEENNYDEIAQITGLTKTNVSVRLVRIKKALEEKLKKQ